MTRFSSLTMRHYFIESRTRKYVKGHRFLSFAKNLSNKYKNQLLDTGLDSLKTASKKGVHITGEFLGNKIADLVTNSYDEKIVKKNLLKKKLFRQKKREE